MRREADRKGWHLGAIYREPVRSQVGGAKPLHISKGLLEHSPIECGNRGIVDDEDIVCLRVEPPDREIRRPGQDFDRGAVALEDHDLVMSEAAESAMYDIWLSGGSLQELLG